MGRLQAVLVVEGVVDWNAAAVEVLHVSRGDAETARPRRGEDEEIPLLDGSPLPSHLGLQGGARERRLPIERDDLASRCQELREP